MMEPCCDPFIFAAHHVAAPGDCRCDLLHHTLRGSGKANVTLALEPDETDPYEAFDPALIGVDVIIPARSADA